jgi:competence protein ComGC
MKKNAFTTVEMMLVLIVIGVLSLLLVPGVWHNAEILKRKSIVQNTATMLNEYLAKELYEDKQNLAMATRWDNMKAVFQYTKACDAEGDAACASPGDDDRGQALAGKGFQLHSGAHLYELFDEPGTWDVIYVDTDGLAGTNTDCEDRFPLKHDHSTGEVTFLDCTVDLVD